MRGEACALRGQPVEVGRTGGVIAVAAEDVPCVVVGKDKQEVGAAAYGLGCGSGEELAAGDCHGNYSICGGVEPETHTGMSPGTADKSVRAAVRVLQGKLSISDVERMAVEREVERDKLRLNQCA